MFRTALVAGIVALLLAGAAALSAQTERPEAIDVDGVAAEQVPVVVPDDGLRRVLVAEVDIFTEGERPVGELISTEEIASYAPKVFARAGGDWAVRLNSDPPREFYVFDPRYAETETGEGRAWVRQPEPATLRLVIPLYQGEEPLEFNTATVVDRLTEAEIITIQR